MNIHLGHLLTAPLLLQPNHAPNIGPEPLDLALVDGLVRVNLRLLPDEVRVIGPDKLGLLHQLPPEKGDGRDQHHGVVREEVLDAPAAGQEDGVPVHADDGRQEDPRDDGGPGLQAPVVGERGPVDALRPARPVEEDVGDADDDIVDDLRRGDDVGEPGEHLGRAARHVEEGEAGEHHDDGEAVDGHAAPRRLAQERGGLALEREAVQAPRAAVRVGVARGEDAGDEERVGDVGQHRDAEVAHGDDVRRGRGGAGPVAVARDHPDQGRVVVRHHDGHRQRAADEEEGEAGVGRLESVLEVPPRHLALARHHGYVLGADDGEGRAPQRPQEPLEPAQVPARDVLGERPRLGPVAEAVGVVPRVAAAHGHQREEEDDEEQEHLA